MHFKTVSIVIEGIRTLLFFSQKILKKNTNPTFKQTKNFLKTLLELRPLWKDFSYQAFEKTN